MHPKWSLVKILNRAKAVDSVDFAQSIDPVDGLERFYRINLSYRVSENSIFEYSRKVDKDWTIEEKPLDTFIETFGMNSRWYLL